MPKEKTSNTARLALWIAILSASVLLLLTACGGPGNQYVSFAQCLDEKGVRMYGSFWCSSCAKQKKLFGAEAEQYLPLVECDPRGADEESELCIKKNIIGYPTWELPGGDMIVGVTELHVLAERTGCALSEES